MEGLGHQEKNAPGQVAQPALHSQGKGHAQGAQHRHQGGGVDPQLGQAADEQQGRQPPAHQLEDEPLDAEIQVAPALQTAAQPPGQPADEIISREKEHQCIGDGQDRRPGRAGKETFEESVHKQDPRSECDEISAIL